jgi:glycosyltransferase involved in cell wall biosynthesis
MSDKIRVIFIPRWYPHRYDPMEGLFIQRQAEALVAFCDVAVIFVHPDPSCPNKVEVDFSEENGVRVMRVYRRISAGKEPLWKKIINLWGYYRAAMKAIRSIRKFNPDIIHAHILTRAGIVAWQASRELKIPFVISEHWSRYFPENFTYSGWLRKLVTARVVDQSGAVIPVSEKLREAMELCQLVHPATRVVANVVDTTLFTMKKEKKELPVVTFIHVSCFDDRSKNISGFLRSIKALSEITTGFHCVMIGNGPDWLDMKDYAAFLRIPQPVLQFTGLIEGENLADAFKNADFSVVSSNYETFGTVIVESLSCGTPVVSTRVGIAESIINADNGILTEPGDDQGMTNALLQMISSCRQYDPIKISSPVAGKFDKMNIGKQLADIYREVIQNH